MPHLTPEKRFDRNGRLVTKHVRSAPLTSAPAALPAPALSAKTVVFPDDSHKKRIRVTYAGTMKPHPELAEALGGSTRFIKLYGTSPEMYDVLAILAPGDAAYAFSQGLASSDAVRDFLVKNSLEHLLVDNTALVKEAMKRRIPATSLLEICDMKTHTSLTPEVLLDAAEAHGMKGLRDYDFYKDIMRGYTTLQDIKAVGVSTITKSKFANDVRELLWDIHNGESQFTLKEVKAMIQKSDKDGISINLTEQIAERFGVEFTLSLHNLGESYDIMGLLTRRKYKDQSAKAIIAYFDEMAHERWIMAGQGEWKSQGEWKNLEYDDCIKFYRAGIDAKTAWDALSRDITLEQTIGIKQGIAPSISGGWL